MARIHWLFLSIGSGLLCPESQCPADWVTSTQRADGFCDPTCMSPFCGYDGYSDCSSVPACYYSNYLGDGYCDSFLAIAECGWDMGDCGHCAGGCRSYAGFQESIGNGVCDHKCNTAGCQFDGGDCVSVTQGDCASGCFSAMLGNGVCESKCLTADCSFDGGDCDEGLCAPGCYPAMLGDGHCDAACYAAACTWDNSDCDCAPGCSQSLRKNGKCDNECAYAACDFDAHQCVMDMKGDCGVGCFERMLGDGHCDSACYSEACEWDHMDCGCAPGCKTSDLSACKSECLVPQCNYGLTQTSLKKLTCSAALCIGSGENEVCLVSTKCSRKQVDVRMNCCANCCDGYHPYSANSAVCVRNPDKSSKTAPQVYFISDASDPKLADGSLQHPLTLRSAFSHLYHAYTTFYLLPGVHDIESDLLYIYSESDSALTSQAPDRIHKLLITSYECTLQAQCTRATLRYATSGLHFSAYAIDLLEITFVDFYSPLEPLECANCLYNLGLINIQSGNALRLTQVAFRHFHAVVQAIIYAEAATIWLTDVDFEDVSLLHVNTFSGGMVYGLNHTNLTYTRGRVELFNNRLNYSNSERRFGFFKAEVAALNVSDVTFSHNFAESMHPTYMENSLIAVDMCALCLFRNCTFRNNVAWSIFHYSGDQTIGYTFSSLRLFSIQSVEFSDCVFANNTAGFGTITIYGFHALLDVTIRNCTFTNELSASYGVVALQALQGAFRRSDTWKYFSENGHKTRFAVPTASVTLSNLRFANCTVTQFGLIAVANFPQVRLSEVEIDSRGAFLGADRYSNTLRDFGNWGLVPDRVPPTPTAECASLLNFTGVRNLTLDSLRSNDVKCAIGMKADGGAISLRNSVLRDSNINQTLLLLATSQSVEISYCDFQRNANKLGTIVVATEELWVRECRFEAVSAAIVVQKAELVDIGLSQFLAGDGKAVTFHMESGDFYLTISHCLFEENRALGAGGAVTLNADADNAVLSLHITDCRFTNNQAGTGSAVFAEQGLSFSDDSEIANCQIDGNEANAVYFASSAGTVRVADCVFTGNRGGTIFQDCFQPCSLHLSSLLFLSNSGPVIQVSSSAVSGRSLTFTHNSGSSVSLTSSSLSADRLSFLTNSAPAGCGLALWGSRASVTSAEFRNNTAVTMGGAVLADGGSEFNCTDCAFAGNTAQQGGALFAKDESAVNLVRSLLQRNFAKEGYALLLASSALPSYLVDSDVSDNAGTAAGVISLMNAKLTLRNTHIRNNTSAAKTAGLVVQQSFLSLFHTEFANQSSTSGCFLYIFHSSVEVVHTAFRSGSAAASGGAILASDSAVRAENCAFHDLSARNGGAVALQNGSSMTLTDCNFTHIETHSPGRGVIEASDSTLSLSGVNFQHFPESAVVGDGLTLTVRTSQFADNGSAACGGGVACESCDQVAISTSLFTRLTAAAGSAVYLIDELPADTSRWEIMECEFSGNTAEDAGTVWLKGAQTTIGNNVFSGNSAGDSGGGLALLGLSAALHNNSFLSNTARQGAGIYWRSTQPTITANLCSGNTAEYGICVGSFAVELRLEENSTVLGLPSGQVSPGGISLLLVDHYGQTVVTDSSSDGWLMTGRNDTNLTGITHANARSGRFLFNEFAVTAQPQSNTSLLASTSALSSSYLKEIRVGLRGCVSGEMLSGNECVVCEAGTYSLAPSQPCTKCPTAAVCLGNFTITPRPGYWRQSPLTDRFFRCPNADSCLGSTGPKVQLTGECAEGYEGNKCQSCSFGFYRWGKVSCAKCPSVGAQVGIRLSIIVTVAALAILIIRSALSERGLHSAYAKVYVNYLQLVMLLGSLHLEWPYLMLRLFNAQESIGAFLEVAFSLRCLWPGEHENDTYFHELVMFSLFPPVLVCVSCGFWLLAVLCRRAIPDFPQKLLGSATIVYFLAYPSVIRTMASAWTFEEIAPGELWVSGQQQQAFTAAHLKYAVGLALPCGLLYGVLVPLALGVVLAVNNRTKRRQFGFWTQGYRPEMYYWEVITTLRLALIVGETALFSRVSAAFQVLSALAILSGSALLHRVCRPFADSTFNVLEARALIIVIMTLYAGLFYYAAELSSAAEWTLSATIVAANVYFTVYCWRKSVGILMFTLFTKLAKRKK